MSIPIKELFWLEQEDLDGIDNFFMPADTPPNCSNAFRHRRRMIREGNDRIMSRVIQKQSREIIDYVDKISKGFDPCLLPEPRPAPSHHNLITGQQYVRQNTSLFHEAMAFVQTNADNVENCTPTLDDLDADHSKEALVYKAECQAQLDAGLSRLRVKHEVQRSHILLHSTYMLHKVLEEQNKTLGPNTTPPRTLPPPIHSINARRDPRNRPGYHTTSPTTASSLAISTAPRPASPNSYIPSATPESPLLPNQPYLHHPHKRSRHNP